MRHILWLMVAILLTACTGEEPRSPDSNPGSGDSGTGDAEGARLRLAEQHGLAYLPLAIMQVSGILDEELTEVGAVGAEWIRTGNAAMIREAMLSGRLDIGFMGIPPFLIGVDRQTDWRLVSGLSEAPLGLVTTRPGYRDLGDIAPRDRIALPQPGSIQHILLAMAAERRFGEPRRFDDQLVSMGHPEGVTALLAGRDVAAHFTAPPYLFQALDHPEATLLLRGEEAFGGRFTFIIGVSAPGWGADPRDHRLMEALFRALDGAIGEARSLQEEIRENEGSSPELLQELSRFYELDVATLRRQLSYPGMVYTREIHGVATFVDRMDRYGYIDATSLPEYRSSVLE